MTVRYGLRRTLVEFLERFMNRKIEAVERSSGWWLVEDCDVIEGPFDSYQDLADYYIRMDYIYV